MTEAKQEPRNPGSLAEFEDGLPATVTPERARQLFSVCVALYQRDLAESKGITVDALRSAPAPHTNE